MANGQRVRVYIDRDSVAMADDVASHREIWDFAASATIDDLLLAISRQLLPGVWGPAGWSIYREPDDPSRRMILGTIYSRDDLRQDRLIGRMESRGHNRLADLALAGELAVQATYLTGNAARLRATSEVSAGPSCTGVQPTVLQSQAREDALVDWRLADENKRRAAEVRGTRRAWIREQLPSIAVLPSAQLFTANNFHYMYDLSCPASMRIVGELIGRPEAPRTGAEVVSVTGNAASATMAMVLAAFEWGIEEKMTWQAKSDACRVYFEFLEGSGYQMSEIEYVIAGRVTHKELTDRQKRIRELRNSEYHLSRNHGVGLMNHDQYLSALAPVSTELAQLGETPDPPRPCCQ